MRTYVITYIDHGSTNDIIIFAGNVVEAIELLKERHIFRTVINIYCE